MTFDEATENINVLSAFSTVYGISPTVVRDIISKLKEEYAPTVDMTVFDRTNAVGLLDFNRDELTFVVGSDGDGTPILDTLPKRYFSAKRCVSTTAKVCVCFVTRHLVVTSWRFMD